jgi:hypothetical protein
VVWELLDGSFSPNMLIGPHRAYPPGSSTAGEVVLQEAMGSETQDTHSQNRSMRRGLPTFNRPGVGFVLLGAVLLWLCVSRLDGEDRGSENEIKSAYLYKFVEFVEYPSGGPASSTFDICVLGNDPIVHDLEKTAPREQLDGRPVRVLHYDRAGEARGCAVVYLCAQETARLDKDLAALEGSDALTVSDLPQFLERGGMIQFLVRNSRIRFAVNLEAVAHARFQLSSELLKVAVFVSPRHAQGGKR